MRQIQFIGEGPSPRDIDSFYREIDSIDQSPPDFQENYPGEYAGMYRSNGYSQLYGVLSGADINLTVRQIAMKLYPYALPEADCLYGPLIVEERVVQGGLSWWRKNGR